MSTLEIIRIAAELLIVCVLVIYYLIKIIKNKWFSKITGTIKDAIVEAENKWPEGHGDEKKSYVIESVKIKCEELGIPFELLYKLINKAIDTIISNYNTLKKGK